MMRDVQALSTRCCESVSDKVWAPAKKRPPTSSNPYSEEHASSCPNLQAPRRPVEQGPAYAKLRLSRLLAPSEKHSRW